MGGNDGCWVELIRLYSTKRTPILTRLEGKKDRADVFRCAVQVQRGLVGRNYGALLDALDPDDARMVHGTNLIEQSILAMLHYIKFYNRGKEGFKAALGPHKGRIEEIIAAVAAARSLDVSIDKTLPGAYEQLVDYVSRICLGRPIMTDNPQFWGWVKGYQWVVRLLDADEEKKMIKTNSFVQMLSVRFKHRERGGDDMDHVNRICQRTVELCGEDDIKQYARKISDEWCSAITEMKVLDILEREFGGIRTEVQIPGSKKNADLWFKHGGEAHFVEVYTPRDFTFDSLSEFRVSAEDEWRRLFRKIQIRELKEAGERTVFVMNVGDRRLDSMEAHGQKYMDHVCGAMPANSEVVIIRGVGDVEVISVRDGAVVEATGLGRRLGFAIGRDWR